MTDAVDPTFGGTAREDPTAPPPPRDDVLSGPEAPAPSRDRVPAVDDPGAPSTWRPPASAAPEAASARDPQPPRRPMAIPPVGARGPAPTSQPSWRSAGAPAPAAGPQDRVGRPGTVTASPVRRRLTPLLAGAGVVLLVGGIGGVVGGAGSLVGTVDRVVDGTVVGRDAVAVPLEAGEVRTLWLEDPARPEDDVRDAAGNRANPCLVTTEGGRVALTTGAASIESNGRRFEAIGSFEAPRDDTYIVRCAHGAVRMAEGTPADGIGAGAGGIVGGVLGIIGGAFALAGSLASRLRGTPSVPGRGPWTPRG